MNGLGLATVLNPEAFEAERDGKTRSELEDVLASLAFKKAPTLCRLLCYLWEQRDGEVSEYAIATEALGRKVDFEPHADATVRVLVSRLRQRLKDFSVGKDTSGQSVFSQWGGLTLLIFLYSALGIPAATAKKSLLCTRLEQVCFRHMRFRHMTLGINSSP